VKRSNGTYRKLKCQLGLMLFIICIFAGNIIGQVSNEPVSLNMPAIALLDIEPDNSTISLTIKTPSEAGQFEFKTIESNAKWINYSSATEPNKRRGIFVQLTSGSVPKGTMLTISAANSIGGAGQLGIGTGSINLSYAPQLLINNIGGAYTGNGVNRGHAISYELEIIDVAQLDFDVSQTVTVSFTILDI
jgi:hypothetical protein